MKKFLYIIVPCMAFVLVVGQIVVTNELAGVGNDIRTLDAQIATLTDEHDLVSQEVASASSLISISQKAQAAGFVAPKKTNIIALDDSSDVAVNPPAGRQVLPGNPSVQ